MPKSDLVPAFYLNQDEMVEKPCRIMTREEARAAKKADEGWFISNGKYFRLRNRVPLEQQKEQTVNGINSCAGISRSEMQANVGIAKSRGAIIRAQEKVKAYPLVYDKLAVTARGRWVDQSCQS